MLAAEERGAEESPAQIGGLVRVDTFVPRKRCLMHWTSGGEVISRERRFSDAITISRRKAGCTSRVLLNLDYTLCRNCIQRPHLSLSAAHNLIDMEPSPGEAAEAPTRAAAQRAPSAHSAGSEDFEDHEAKTKAAEEAKEAEAGKKKGGGLFGALGFGKGKSERQDEAAGETVGSSAARHGAHHGDDDDEEEERPDSESEEEGEEGANGSNGSKQSGGDGGSQEEPKDGAVEEPAPKKAGIMGMFRSPFALRKKPADDEQKGGDLEGRAPGTPPRKHLSPRGQAAPAASSTRTAVQRAVERSVFVKLGRLTRVFWRDSAMQTGKEGSVEIARIAAANPYSMRALQQRVHNMQRTVMVLSIVGLLSGIVVNEWCWLGYIPTEEEEEGFCSVPGVYQNATGCRAIGGSWTDGIPDPTQREGGQRCRSPDDPIAYVPGIVLKSMCSALTGFLLMALFHLYECIALELCFRNHLEYHREFVDVSFWNLGLLPEFLLEFFVCIVHPGPRIHFNIPIEARGRMTVYNSEVRACVYIPEAGGGGRVRAREAGRQRANTRSWLAVEDSLTAMLRCAVIPSCADVHAPLHLMALLP